LQIPEGGTGTLNFATAAPYANIAILANSAFGASETPVATIYFQDGTAVHTTFKAFDWSVGANGGSSVFGAAGVNRYSPTVTPNQDTRAFSMYETDIDLTNIGGVDYSLRPISAITFNATTFDTQNRGLTEVYAVSGAARTTTNNGRSGVYGNDVSVTADSTIDVAGIDAIMGNLTIGSNALTVNSDDSSGQPYVLAFTTTTITTGGSPVFHINPSATGGAGTVVLNEAAGQVATPSAALAGGGTVAVVGTYSKLSVDSGTVAIQPHGGIGESAIVASALNLTGTGTLNLTNNDLVLHQSGSAAEADLRGLLRSAFDNGKWDGHGLTSSGAGSGIGLGYAAAGGSTLLVKLATVGDTDLSGDITQADVSAMADYYDPDHIKAQNWSQGDFNYDGYTDSRDINMVLSLYSASGSSPITAAEFSQLQSVEAAGSTGSAVPEPSSLALIGLSACMLGRRRVRRNVGG
jgi:hypothetical protein